MTQQNDDGATKTLTPAERHRLAFGDLDGLDEMTRCPLMPTYGPPSVQFIRGEGPYLWDADDKRYLDFL